MGACREAGLSGVTTLVVDKDVTTLLIASTSIRSLLVTAMLSWLCRDISVRKVGSNWVREARPGSGSSLMGEVTREEVWEDAKKEEEAELDMASPMGDATVRVKKESVVMEVWSVSSATEMMVKGEPVGGTRKVDMYP